MSPQIENNFAIFFFVTILMVEFLFVFISYALRNKWAYYISIFITMLYKDGIPKDLRKKLGIK